MKCHGKGLFSAITAAVGYAVAALLSRRGAEAGVPAVQLVAVNEVAATAVFSPLAVICCCIGGTCGGEATWCTWRRLAQLVACGLVRVACTSSILVSGLLIPPGNTFAIGRGAVSPIVTSLVAWRFIKEPPGRVVLVGMAIRIAAIGLIVAGSIPKDEKTDGNMAFGHTNTPRVANRSFDIFQATSVTPDLNTTSPVYINSIANYTSNIPASQQTSYIIGNVLAFIGPIGFCFVNVTLRSLLEGARVPVTTCLAFVEGLGSVFLVPIMFALVTPKWRLKYDVALYLAGQGSVWVLAAFCLSLSFVHEKAIVVEMMQGVSISLAFLLQYLFLGIEPRVLELAGAGLLVFTIILVSAVSWWKAAHKEKVKEEEYNDSNANDVIQKDSERQISDGIQVVTAIPEKETLV